MSEHTPGPWSIRFGGGIEDDGFCVASENAINPSVVAEYWPPVCMDKKQMVANARLIAAAPELLEAAKLTLARHDGPMDMSEDDWDELRAAIAKAEGGEA